MPVDPEFAITVFGQDRPGIIAATAAILAEHGLNLADSSMTLLRGHFAMTLICSGPSDAATLRDALAPLADTRLSVEVREIATGPTASSVAGSHLVTVHGADRLGIVAGIARRIAEVGGNITDLSTRLAGGLYVVAAEVDLPAGVDPGRLTEAVSVAAAELGVEAGVRTLDRDEL